MKADTLHKQLVNLLTGYTYPHGSYIIENGTFFNFVKDLLLNADTKTRKVLLHWLKGFKKIAIDGPGSCSYNKFSHYMQSPWALISQMLDHLEHLNYAQKIKAPVNYDPLSYPTHFDCLNIIKEYPLPANPISPDKFRYLNKVTEMFDDSNNCYTVYKFINRKSDSLYELPKDAFIAFMKSHFGKHAMPWCICDENRSYWHEDRYAKKYLVFKNNKLYAAAASASGSNRPLVLYDRCNQSIAVMYLPCLHENPNYLIRFFHITKEDELTFRSTAASMFDPPVIPGCVHRDYPTDIVATTPFRYLCSNEKGFQWFSYDKKVPTKQGLPTYSVILNGEYTLPSTKCIKRIIRYRVKLTVDNDKDTPLHIVTRVNLEEATTKWPDSIDAEREYNAQMTKEEAASLIERYVKERLARTSKEPNNEQTHFN